MEFKHKVLDNGLTIAGEVDKAFQSAAIGFFVKTGSRDETAKINGVSHFLEHMLFKGTDKLSALEVNASFDKTGAQFNAFTSEENTVFYAAVLPEYLLEVTELWCQLMRPALRDDDFNMEKNVILEEIAMYKDMPHFDVMDSARSLHFKYHPCGNGVLGSNESIKNLTAEQMRDYFTKRYSPENITVVCCGNFDWEEFCNLVERKCGNWEIHQATRKTYHFEGTFEQITTKKAGLVREHICLVNSSVSAQSDQRYAATLLSIIMGDDTGSRYFWNLVDSALAEVATAHFEDMDGTGALYSYVRCSSDNSEQVNKIIEQVLNDLYQNGITEDELIKAKNKVLSTVTLKNELPMGRLIEVGFNWTYMKQYTTIQNEIESFKSVTVEDVNNLIKECDLRKYTKVSLKPE